MKLSFPACRLPTALGLLAVFGQCTLAIPAANNRAISRHSLIKTRGTDYAPGFCGVHVIQYQKDEGPGPSTQEYRFTVTLYDNDHNNIGGVTLLPIASGQTADISSQLPYQFEVTAGYVDSDPVGFAYAGDVFNSNSEANHYCSVGGYDSGSRQMDCGFSC